jgi:rRNA maturation endonuclease Nob1
MFRRQRKAEFESYREPYEYTSKTEKKSFIRYCPECRGVIKEPVAKYCYHCGTKLKDERQDEDYE